LYKHRLLKDILWLFLAIFVFVVLYDLVLGWGVIHLLHALWIGVVIGVIVGLIRHLVRLYRPEVPDVTNVDVHHAEPVMKAHGSYFIYQDESGPNMSVAMDVPEKDAAHLSHLILANDRQGSILQ